jgi:hypothetical protein
MRVNLTAVIQSGVSLRPIHNPVRHPGGEHQANRNLPSWIADWKDAGGKQLPTFTVHARNPGEALELALALREKRGVILTLWTPNYDVAGRGTVSPEGFWITREPPTLQMAQQVHHPEPLELKKLTRFQFRARMGALVAWSVGSFIGCESTKQRTAKSVHVRSRNGGYWRRPPGGKQSDDRANAGTLWMRCLIFLGWATGAFAFSRMAFYQKKPPRVDM